jgi:hypothetical protein
MREERESPRPKEKDTSDTESVYVKKHPSRQDMRAELLLRLDAEIEKIDAKRSSPTKKGNN